MHVRKQLKQTRQARTLNLEVCPPQVKIQFLEHSGDRVFKQCGSGSIAPDNKQSEKFSDSYFV